MDTNDIYKIFRAVIDKTKCPKCGRKYNFSDIHIVNSVGNVCFLRLNCSQHIPVLASVAINLPAKNQINPITTEETLKFYQKLNCVKSIKELFN